MKARSDLYFPQCFIFSTGNIGSNHASYMKTFSPGGLKQYIIRAKPAVGADD